MVLAMIWDNSLDYQAESLVVFPYIFPNIQSLFSEPLKLGWSDIAPHVATIIICALVQT